MTSENNDKFYIDVEYLLEKFQRIVLGRSDKVDIDFKKQMAEIRAIIRSINYQPAFLYTPRGDRDSSGGRRDFSLLEASYRK